MSESIRTVWDWEIGGDRYYYEMPAFDSVHAECYSYNVVLSTREIVTELCTCLCIECWYACTREIVTELCTCLSVY